MPEQDVIEGLAAQRMRLIIKNNTKVIQGAEKILDILTANPELDEYFCLLFGIQALPAK
jgi:hypothetical protein